MHSTSRSIQRLQLTPRELRLQPVDALPLAIHPSAAVAMNPSVLVMDTPQLGSLARPAIAKLRSLLTATTLPVVSRLPRTSRFPVASADGEHNEVRLPFGVPRFARAVVLKKLAGGRLTDNMLEQKGDEWEFVADDAVIDLLDRSRIFKIGRALILS